MGIPSFYVYPGTVGEFKPKEKIILKKFPTIDSILKVVSDYYKVPIIQITGKLRKSHVVIARHWSQYLIYTHCNMSSVTVGEIFDVHYSSVLHGRDKIMDLISYSNENKELLPFFESKIL